MTPTMTPARRVVRAFTAACIVAAASVVLAAHALGLLLTYLITGSV